LSDETGLSPVGHLTYQGGIMKSIGYAGGRLYGCKAGPYSVVVAAPDRKTAVEAFQLFLRDRNHNAHLEGISVKPAKTLGNRPLFWAQVDVTQS
jgi:hypothetical protein